MTPAFVTDAWYVIAWSEELPANGRLAKTILGRPIVAFRGEDGVARAVADRCPHRGVPLSMGTVVDNHIRCPYHALEFDGGGICVRNPHIKADPGRLTVPHHPVVERHGAVWVWMGHPSAADAARIPDYSWFDGGASPFRTVRGHLLVQGEYRLVIDNLMDLSHAEYVHPTTVGTPGASGSVRTSLDVGTEQVTVLRKVFDVIPAAVFRPVWTKSDRIDQQSNMTWRAPSHLLLDLAVMPPGGQLSEGLRFPSAHLLTPETARTTHYFYAIARDFLLDDEALDARILASIEQAFGQEDRPIIEAIQRAAVDPADGFTFTSFTMGDAASTRVRRMLDELAEAAAPLRNG